MPPARPKTKKLELTWDIDRRSDSADANGDAAASTATNRPANMNAFGAPQQPARQSRLQNTQKTAGLGMASGWGFGLTSSALAAAGNAQGLGGGSAPAGGLGGGLGGALRGAPGLGGSSRPSHLSGFAQVIGGGNGSGQGPIDMSDFPSLSGGPQPSSTQQPSWNSNTIRQQQHQQQQPPNQQPPVQQQRQQQPISQQRAASAAPSQQSIGDQLDGRSSQPASAAEQKRPGEDFPPLGRVQLLGDPFGQPNGFGSSVRSPDGTQQPNSHGTQLPIRDISNGLQAPIGTGEASTASQPPQSAQNGQTPTRPPGMKKYADMSDSEKWGLESLQAAYEARKAMENGQSVDETLPPVMRSAIFFGHDLNALGLDLESEGPLYPTFTPFPSTTGTGGAFDFHDRHIVPDFELPSAYTVTNVPPLASRLGAVSDETLFCIFYQSPRSILQEQAAQELTARDWRWHKVLRQWLQKDGAQQNSTSTAPVLDLTQGIAVGTAPVRVGDNMERGVYIFFDVANWRRERREFVLDYGELDLRSFAGVGLGGGPVMPVANGGRGSVASGMGSSGVPSAV